MILDSEEQRTFLLEVLEKVTIPGSVVDFYTEVRRAVREAKVAAHKAPARPAGAD